jgi:hypothetical protein
VVAFRFSDLTRAGVSANTLHHKLFSLSLHRGEYL